MRQLFQDAIPVINEIEKAGFEAYFVGGSIRDFLLQKDISDVDIATSATPEEIKQIFPKTIDIGIAHGTVMVFYNGQSYEITTYRSDGIYSDHRRPNEVIFIRSLHKDLERRDFTMNAIAMDKNGRLYDPFNGTEAIREKVIQCVGIAHNRFQEDALRMMRAVRFVSQLSFTIEACTYIALKEKGYLLSEIAVERITAEFEKLLEGESFSTAISMILHTELYKYLPELSSFKKELQIFSELPIQKDFSIEEKWILLLYTLRIEEGLCESFLRSWKLSGAKIKRIKKGLHWLKHRESTHWTKFDLYSAGREITLSTEKLHNTVKGYDLTTNIQELSSMLDGLVIHSRSELTVTGSDLMRWYERQGGKWIEETLRVIEVAIVNNEVENRNEAIKEWLVNCNQA